MLPLLVVAVGQTFVLITAGIDLSVTSIVSLASVVGAAIMTADNGMLAGSPMAVPAAVTVMIAVGMSIGLLNGAAITLFDMPPFIVTLTTMTFIRGYAIWHTQSQNIFNLPDSFNIIGYGEIAKIPIYQLIITIVVLITATIVLNRSLLGRWIYAVGHNVKTSLISGVPVKRTLLCAYTISGVCAGVASILYTSRIETGSPTMGDKILLDVIGATVIGGTSLFGGKGKIKWTVFGVLFITLIDNTLNMYGLSFFVVMMVKGGVILLAAFMDAIRNRILAGA